MSVYLRILQLISYLDTNYNFSQLNEQFVLKIYIQKKLTIENKNSHPIKSTK